MTIKLEHTAVLVGLGVAGVLAWCAMQSAGGPAIPAYSEDVNNVFAGHLAEQSELPNVTWTRHRYPAGIGGEITALLSGGWSSIQMPDVPSAQWMTRPPGNEGIL